MPAFEGRRENRRMKLLWTEGNYRRIFLDMHIDDWNGEFLSKVDPRSIVNLLKDAGAQQIVVKCRTHTGLAHYPTKIGRMHRGLSGRDYVKEMIECCHEAGIAVMAYFSQIFDNYAYETHPEWRAVNGLGYTSREIEDYDNPNQFRKGRYGICCPNNVEYRSYVRDCLTEITANYQFESIFLDMPYWPEVCYCQECRAKYKAYSGRDIPRVVNWGDPEFRKWQALREEWIAEFAAASTAAVKAVRPGVTVEHNMSVATSPWYTAATELIAGSCDYTGGDLFGGYLEQTFICKYYKNLSKSLPFVYITSRCDPDLLHHTTTKSEDELLLHGITALVHNGAFSICDGANPDGTICEDVYTGVIRHVFDRTRDYEKYMSGDMITDVSIWFPEHAKFDLKDNGRPVYADPVTCGAAGGHDYLTNLLQMTRILRDENIPFDVVPGKKLKSGLDNSTLTISGAAFIPDGEMDAIEKFIRGGGRLYISGHIGHPRLLEMLEAGYEGETEHNVTYMSPTESGKRFFSDFSGTLPMAVHGKQVKLALKGDYELLATITLPYTMTGKREFSAIHSDPPGIRTEYPAAVLKNIGKGKILWTAAPIENSRPYMSRKAVGKMIRELAGNLSFTSDAPACVEVLGWKKGGKHYFAAVNQQETAPVAPMYNIEVILPETVRSAHVLESGEVLRVDRTETGSVIYLPRVDIFLMFEVEMQV